MIDFEGNEGGGGGVGWAEINAINEAIRAHFDRAVARCYNRASRLSKRDEVEEMTNDSVNRDYVLVGKVMALAHVQVLSVNRVTGVQRILGNHRQQMRRWLREERVEAQMSLLDDATLAVMMRDGFIEAHGRRVIAVPGKDENRRSRDKWEWFRFVEHAKPSDLKAGISTKAQVVNDQRDAIKLDEILLALAKKVNPAAYRNNSSLGVIFGKKGADDAGAGVG